MLSADHDASRELKDQDAPPPAKRTVWGLWLLEQLSPGTPSRDGLARAHRRFAPKAPAVASAVIFPRRAGLTDMSLLCVALLSIGCSRKIAEPPPGPDAWLLAGTDEERFARIARQLRGFDVAMVEVGYRYGELHWAGQDGDWAFASYQLQKIRTALANGVERRPKRGPSARMLEGALGGVEEAVAAKDPALFTARFTALTGSCNACHLAEQVPFVHVRPPEVRCSPAGPLPGDGGR
ncbi:MAG: hypothetical protein JNK82_03300 [Myxococcaceae bacterium]|nr:hypothetical protein [Myxococcaceae bacterium]